MLETAVRTCFKTEIECTKSCSMGETCKLFAEDPKNSSYLIKSKLKVQDIINHPPHYTAHPSGIECIQITEHMNFNLGNAVKYIWRAGLKTDAIEDLKKSRWYIDREIAKLEKAKA